MASKMIEALPFLDAGIDSKTLAEKLGLSIAGIGGVIGNLSKRGVTIRSDPWPGRLRYYWMTDSVEEATALILNNKPEKICARTYQDPTIYGHGFENWGIITSERRLAFRANAW